MCEKGKEELKLLIVQVHQIYLTQGNYGTMLMLVWRVSSLIQYIFVLTDWPIGPGSFAVSLISPSSQYREMRKSERAALARNDR